MENNTPSHGLPVRCVPNSAAECADEHHALYTEVDDAAALTDCCPNRGKR